jgi:muconolactone delta-isomerase
MLFMLHVKLAKPASMSNQEFYGVWQKESEAAIAALKVSVIEHLYKVPGKNEVIIIMNLDTADDIDHLIQNTPIFQMGYAHIVTEATWTPLRPYENWMEDLNQLSQTA